MTDERQLVLALFYCQNTPKSDEQARQALEAQYGNTLRLFPIPCSGRLEPLHLLRALEEFADAAYLIACPEGTCRYFEGNQRAKKRVERTRTVISDIGLEADRVGMIIRSGQELESLSQLAKRVTNQTSNLPPSPVHRRHIHH
jgi:coenzyme F420-reducing hydrogenase delta subunit